VNGDIVFGCAVTLGIGVLGIATTLFLHMLRYSHIQGRTAQRMDHFERQLDHTTDKTIELDKAHNQVLLSVERLNGKVDNVTSAVDEIKDMLTAALNAKPRRGRALLSVDEGD
jgi:uncharacterized protein YoxC